MLRIASTTLIIVGALTIAGCTTTERNLTGAAVGGGAGAAVGGAIAGTPGAIVGGAGGAAAGVAVSDRI